MKINTQMCFSLNPLKLGVWKDRRGFQQSLYVLILTFVSLWVYHCVRYLLFRKTSCLLCDNVSFNIQVYIRWWVIEKYGSFKLNILFDVYVDNHIHYRWRTNGVFFSVVAKSPRFTLELLFQVKFIVFSIILMTVRILFDAELG